jgi:hypothetical protein
VTKPSESLYKNITLNDVQLASAYYPILVELARHKHRLTYSELVEKAKEKYPDKPVVRAGPTPLNNQARSDKCIPVSVVKRPWAVVAG